MAERVDFRFTSLAAGGLREDGMGGIPAKPAVFRIFDLNGKLILLEKTHNLRLRLERFYSDAPQPGAVDLREIGERIEYCRTDSPFESVYLLYLERRKQFPSRYRRMRTFPLYTLLEIDTRARFPRIEVARSVRDGARFFGPFSGRRTAEEARTAMERLFRLRPCDYDIRGDDPYPDCLYFQMETCSRPCNGDIGREVYLEDTDAAIAWLRGNETGFGRTLLERIRALADETRFEEAEQVRLQLESARQKSGAYRVFELAGFDYVVLLKAASVRRRKTAFIRNGGIVGIEEHAVAELADSVRDSLTRIWGAEPPEPAETTYDEFCLAASFLRRSLPSARFFQVRSPEETARELAKALQPSGETAGTVSSDSLPPSGSAPNSSS